MPKEFWYYHHDGTRFGPVSQEKLTTMARSGVLLKTDLVWKKGMEDWVPASSVPEFFPPPAPHPEPSDPATPAGDPFNLDVPAHQPTQPNRPIEHPTHSQPDSFAPPISAAKIGQAMTSEEVHKYLPHLKAVDLGLEGIKAIASQKTLDRVDLIARNIGNIAYIAAATLAILSLLALAGETESAFFFFAAIAVAPAAVILQFVAVQFLSSGKMLIDQTPSQLSSDAFLRVFALLQVVLAVLFGSAGYYSFARLGSLQGLFWGMLLFVSAAYNVVLALNPNAVNVEVSSTASAGEEAIGILAFVAKAHLRMVGALFGTGSIFGVLAMFYVLYQLLVKESYVGHFLALPASIAVLSIGLLPFFTYVAFLFTYLLIDVLRAILSIPKAVNNSRLDDSIRGASPR